MKKPLILTLIFLMSACGLFAQSENDKWNVYNVQTGQETVTDLMGMIPKAIVGRDDRTNITGRATDFEKSAVILEMKSKRGSASLCSGAMIGPNLVLTAAHCLTEGKNFMQSVQVFATGLSGTEDQVPPPSTNPRTPNHPATPDWAQLINKLNNKHKTPSPHHLLGLFNKKNKMTAAVIQQSYASLRAPKNTFPSAQATQMWVPQEWRNATNNSEFVDLAKAEPYDYGILILDRNLGDQTGYMKIASKSTKELKNKNIILLGRGGDKPSRTLWRAEGSIGAVTSQYIYHNADMVGGNSGGPVVLASDPYTIVALNNFGPIQERMPEGTFPNGCLRISTKIINAVNLNSN